jgi:glycosyltransferase 2 family protein
MMRTALRVVAIVAVALGLWFTLRSASGAQLLHALARTRIPFVAVWGVALLAIGSVARALRFVALLSARPRAPLVALWTAVLLGSAGNNVLPLRAGELVRTRETVAAGYPIQQVAVAQVAEKVVDAASLIAYATPVLAMRLGGGPRLVLAGLLLAGVVLVGRAARRFRVQPRQLAASLAWSLVADAVEVAIIAVCLHGLGLPGGLVPSVTVFVGVNLAIALPSTPGNVGTLEAGSALPLIALGVNADAAVAFALVYRTVQWLPVTLVGGIVWARRMMVSPARAGAS